MSSSAVQPPDARALLEAIEVSPDAIVILVEGRVVYANGSAARMLGLGSPEQLVGTRLAERIDPEDVPVMIERMARVMAGESLLPRDYRSRRPDGSLVQIEIASQRFEYQGRPAVLAFGRDVGERRKLQTEAVGNERISAVSTVAAGVAHEINNPLTYVLLHLRRLRDLLPGLVQDEPARSRITQLLDEAVDGGERVRTIVRDLLSFSRAEGAPPQPVDVTRVVDAALKIATSAQAQSIRVVRQFEQAPPVMANESRLGQVFLNLLVNAVQSLPSGVDEAEVRVAVAPDGHSYVAVRIEDNGVGMDEDVLRRVFDPFFTTKEERIGTGLGLTITRSILDAMGGEIRMTSQPGRGTQVVVRLPTGRAEPGMQRA